MSQSSVSAVVPEVMYQNDVGREPMAMIQLAQNQAAQVVPLAIQRPNGAELLPSFETLKLIEKLAAYVVRSGQFKARFSNEAQVIVTLLKGHDLGISFADALEHVYVVNGKPGVSGQLMLRLIYTRVRNPRNETLVEFREMTATKATVAMHRPGQKDENGQPAWVVRSFTIEQADKAGLLFKWKDTPGGERQKTENFVWHAYREEMLLWRAVAKCARIVFSDAIGGVYFYDELVSGPLNDPTAAVPGREPPAPKAPKGNRKKKEKKNGLSDAQQESLHKALHAATLVMDPLWPTKIPADQAPRFRDTRKLVYESACQEALGFVPDKINSEQAATVQKDLEKRAKNWQALREILLANAQAAGAEDTDAAAREIWEEAWKAEGGDLPEPKALAAADDALRVKLLEGLTKNLERLKDQDGEEEKE